MAARPIGNIHFPIDGVRYRSQVDAHTYFRAGAWINGTVGGALDEAATRWPQKIAIVDDQRRITFAEWNVESRRLAAGLRALGLLPGDRAIFQLGTVSETAIALCACFLAGIVPV